VTDERVLVTGGAGFVGSAFVRRLLAAEPTTRVISFDALTYAGHLENLEDLPDPDRHDFVRGDIAEGKDVAQAFAGLRPTAVVNFAAETHVDQSLLAPARFVRTNVVGTQVLLDACRKRGIRLVHVSTDEVYGSLPDGRSATPASPLAPTSPYAASKAAADLLVLAAWRSHDQDVLITRSTNNYGPRQLPEKLVPLMVLRALAGRPLPVYGDGLHVRDWLHVDDHAAGVHAALRRARAGSVHHLAGGNPKCNLAVVEAVREAVGRTDAEIRHVADRPGHDRRYAIDDRASRADLDWAPTVLFDEGLAATVAWYRENTVWCECTGSEELRTFLAKNYAERLGEDA
jgi:dTDP-glucose 4,6-dehydratase